MKTRNIMTIICCVCLAYGTVAEAAKKSGVLVLFQEALEGAEYEVESSGDFDEQTRAAMQSLQEENGLSVTDYPDVQTLSLLEVHPSAWAGIVRAAGASDDEIDATSDAAQKKIAESLADSMHDVFAPGMPAAD